MAKGSEFKLEPGGLDAKVPTKFVDRSLMGVKPQQQQFEPTKEAPVPQRYKMGGGCS